MIGRVGIGGPALALQGDGQQAIAHRVPCVFGDPWKRGADALGQFEQLALGVVVVVGDVSVEVGDDVQVTVLVVAVSFAGAGAQR